MRPLSQAAVLVLLLAVTPAVLGAEHNGDSRIDPRTVPKWANEIGPVPAYSKAASPVDVDVSAFNAQVLPPGFPETPVFGYGGQAVDSATGAPLGYVRGYPGPSFVVAPGETLKVKWTNRITAVPHLFPVDPTLWDGPFDAQTSVPIVAHVHGSASPSASDGHPDAYWTAAGQRGPTYSSAEATGTDSAVFVYPNAMKPTTLWHHDHVAYMTRLNVLAGMAGFYIIKHPVEASVLPSGPYEIPIVMQDRTFRADGSIYIEKEGDNPSVHPNWNPEYFGDVVVVNGKAWPNLQVARGAYRFRMLNGADSRFFDLALVRGDSNTTVPFTMIGTDGVFRYSPATLSSILLAPGERADIVVDFSPFPPNTKLYWRNSAPAPFPDGDPVDPETTRLVMRFNVAAAIGVTLNSYVSNPTLAGPFPNLPAPTVRRQIVLTEAVGENGPTGLFINGLPFEVAATEFPKLGGTEDWMFINPTQDTHPMHIHLVQFQIASRQKFRAEDYLKDWQRLNEADELPLSSAPRPLDVTPYLQGNPEPAEIAEQGWKDTGKAPPGYVTIFGVRFTGTRGEAFPFNATAGPGYVYHCHILHHEDNAMMRPFVPVA
ncbi:bilirubin oxidase [Hyaloraphidium curvatum]|nr:bilirubin oxidase [Hyaloraphidium curvatum]